MQLISPQTSLNFSSNHISVVVKIVSSGFPLVEIVAGFFSLLPGDAAGDTLNGKVLHLHSCSQDGVSAGPW